MLKSRFRVTKGTFSTPSCLVCCAEFVCQVLFMFKSEHFMLPIFTLEAKEAADNQQLNVSLVKFYIV